MRFLRSVAGYTLRDHQRTENIREELNIFELNNKVKEYRDKWKRHINKMPEDSLPRIYYKYKPRGKKKTWKTKEEVDGARINFRSIVTEEFQDIIEEEDYSRNDPEKNKEQVGDYN